MSATQSGAKSGARLLPASAEPFHPHAAAPVTKIDRIEGVPMAAAVELRTGVVTPTMSLVEVFWPKDSSSRPHVHPDHDSVVYVVRGRLRMHVADRAFDAGPGDSLAHLPGVEHWIEALEDSVTIEVKSPPIRTW